jgi:hypothetical protein
MVAFMTSLAIECDLAVAMRDGIRLFANLPRSQSLEYSFSPLAPPIGEQTRVQTFAAEQSAQTTSRRTNNFSFFEDALLKFRGVGPPLWCGNYFGVRP